MAATQGINKIYVIDPGMAGVTTHHHAWNMPLQRKAQEEGLDIRFFLREKCAPEDAVLYTQAERKLVFSFYKPFSLEPSLEDMRAQISHAFYMQRDIAALAERFPVDENTLFFNHTADAPGILGMALWRAAQPAARRPHMVFNLQYYLRIPNELTLRLYALAVEHLKDDPKARFYGMNDAICALLEGIAGRKVPRFPFPFEAEPEGSAQAGGDNPDTAPVFGFMTNNNTYKNVGVIPAAIGLYLRQGGKGSFRIHFSQPELSEEACRDMRLVAEARPDRVAFLPGYISQEAYAGFMRGFNVALLPFKPEVYHLYRPSQFFHETVRLGIPAIVVGGGYLEREAGELDNGSLVIDRAEPAQLAGAMLEFDRNGPELWRKAKTAAAEHRAFHNMDNLWRTLLDIR